MNTRNFWWMVLAFAIVEFVGTIMTVHTRFTWWPVVATSVNSRNLSGSCKLQLFQRRACTPSADIGNNAQLERSGSIELDEVILDLDGSSRRAEVVLLAYDLPVRRLAVG